MLPLIGKRVTGLAGVILALSIGNAYAFGNACKNVNFSIDNGYQSYIEVASFELWSESEGRWLKEDFRNIFVPPKDFVVRRGEDIEYGENDRITQIRVKFRVVPLDAYSYATDTNINDPVCAAGRWYKATIPG